MAASFSSGIEEPFQENHAGTDGGRECSLTEHREDNGSAGTGALRYVARQPILDARGQVHGYELLFRSGPAATAFSGDGDAATRTVLDNAMLFGIERLTAGLPAFVNCTQEALEQELVTVLPAGQTVLEVLETLHPSPALLSACRKLKALGYRLALDDFEWQPEWEDFLQLADYVKVDLSTSNPRDRVKLMRRLKTLRTLPVAERVETPADFKLAQAEGFLLFQGFYFCRPVLLEHRSVPANRLAQLEILAALQEEPLNTPRLSGIVMRDAALTYRLLRLANSPMYGTGKVIRSIQSALVMIGDQMFRRLATLALVAEIGNRQTAELLRMALTRGKFCELATAATGRDAREQYLLGILSLLPAMLQSPIEAILGSLPLRDEICRALKGEPNPERAVLEWLISYEQGEWDRCDDLAAGAGMRGQNLAELYAQSVAWAESNLSLASEPAPTHDWEGANPDQAK